MADRIDWSRRRLPVWAVMGMVAALGLAGTLAAFMNAGVCGDTADQGTARLVCDVYGSHNRGAALLAPVIMAIAGACTRRVAVLLPVALCLGAVLAALLAWMVWRGSAG